MALILLVIIGWVLNIIAVALDAKNNKEYSYILVTLAFAPYIAMFVFIPVGLTDFLNAKLDENEQSKRNNL